MAFGTATVVTNKGKAMFADRIMGTPGTYTNAPKHVAIGVGATGADRTAAAADTALSSEVETRTSGTESTQTTSVTGDTYRGDGCACGGRGGPLRCVLFGEPLRQRHLRGGQPGER
jgi:hypothetical protein